MNLDPVSRSLIVSHARSAAPYEACGLISERSLGDDRYGVEHLQRKIWHAENAADEPRHNYLIDAKEQLALLEQIVREDHELVGLFHSHPNCETAEPSDVDRVLAAGWPDLIHVIVALGGEQPDFWIGKLIWEQGKT